MIRGGGARAAGEDTPLMVKQLLANGDPPSSYGLLVAFAVMINYIIGTGVFSLPYAFIQAGSLLSIISILVFGGVSTLCAVWVLEFMARTEGVIQHTEMSSRPLRPSEGYSDDLPPKNQIGFRKLDFSLISQTFGGWKLRLFTQVPTPFMSYPLVNND
jgi:hypothetical protein